MRKYENQVNFQRSIFSTPSCTDKLTLVLIFIVLYKPFSKCRITILNFIIVVNMACFDVTQNPDDFTVFKNNYVILF